MMNNFCILFFTSTKGHYGCKDIYKTTLKSLVKNLKSCGDIFPPLIAHIKISPGEANVANKMANWITKQYPNASIITSEGEWSHNGTSHGQYLLDISKQLTNALRLGYDYYLHLEDDFVFNTDNIIGELRKGVKLLNQNVHLLNYRWAKEGDGDFIERTKATRFESADNKRSLGYRNGAEISFNPYISKIKDMYYIVSLTVGVYPTVSLHCEMAVTLSALSFALCPDPFIIMDNADSVKMVTHIGTKEFAEKCDKSKSNKK